MPIRTAFMGIVLAATPALGQDTTEVEAWAHLPEPVTNNAVAGIELDGRLMAYSFAGLHAGKTWRDVTADAYACDLDARTCREIDGLPDGIGRLASIAVTVRDQIYIFGGYTVAEDGSERSTPEVWRFDPASETYTHVTDMPVPVDDTVALPFQDRYIYLVSGWHDTDNVDLVQVYDVEEDRWLDATPFPGAPVFGHAGSMQADGRILICGGTAVIPAASDGERRSFEAIDDCWSGRVAEDGDTIEWLAMPPIAGGPFYRGTAYTLHGQAVFLGGTDNSFNYNGIGYNNLPSEPRADRILMTPPITGSSIECPAGTTARTPQERGAIWSRQQSSWLDVMDIRGIVLDPSDIRGGYILGGMGPDQTVLDVVRKLPDGLVSGVLLANPSPVCVDP